uniref:Retrotransposon protein, putative, unclassified n=2 Tax=Oryza sativa subsp. japonica TaxID=39947 RepID=Q53KD9_ORYSJ|nr:transposon protein, putative, CACTA, En/Spm sub-class [Oryza sativa Japonica Group]ABA93163.1 retrotransposon protein, putative, unclassified [Oryza sativa Japonica Group]
MPWVPCVSRTRRNGWLMARPHAAATRRARRRPRWRGRREAAPAPLWSPTAAIGAAERRPREGKGRGKEAAVHGSPRVKGATEEVAGEEGGGGAAQVDGDGGVSAVGELGEAVDGVGGGSFWDVTSTLLGFHDSCKIDLQKGISWFEKNRFGEDISCAPICKKPRTNDIHNPTLRLMHKWIAMTLFPRSDLRPIRGDELIIMFAMVRKIKIAPMKCIIRQWLESIKFPIPVECTSLITRIAKGLGVVSNQIAFISATRPCIDENYLVQGHILKHGVDGSLIYIFPGCTNEIPLPNAGYHLYNCHKLTIPLQTIEESRTGGAYRETRNMTRNERENSSSSIPVQMYEADWAPTGMHPDGPKLHATASESQLGGSILIKDPERKPSLGRDISPLTKVSALSKAKYE